MAMLDTDIGAEEIITVSSRGFGDSVAKVIKTVSGGRIKPCGGCQKRRQKLNEIFPYKEK